MMILMMMMTMLMMLREYMDSPRVRIYIHDRC